MLQELRRLGFAALLVAAIAAPGSAQDDAREKFIVSGPAEEEVERNVPRDASEKTTPKGRKIAIVIAVSDLEREELKAERLPYVENDARRMIETLYNDGFSVWPLCEKTVPTPRKSEKKVKKIKEPTKENIEATVADVLENHVEKDDVVFVYFSGHGLEGDDDSTYLFAKDSDNRKVEETCVAVSELRRALADSPTRYCLLSLDSCSAAGTRAPSYFEEFQHFIEGGTAGVATFASCMLDEKSDGWTPFVEDPNDVADSGQERCVSIFTYWLNAGLKGFADGALGDEPDGKIASDELFAYVDDNVAFHNAEQTSHVVAKRNEKPFVMCDVAPMTYDDAMRAVAKQIVTKAKFMRRGKVEFNLEAVGVEDWERDAKAVDALTAFANGAKNNLQKQIEALMEDVEDVEVKEGDGKSENKAGGSVAVDATVERVDREIADANGETKTISEYVLVCRFDESNAKGRAGEITARILPKSVGASFENDVEPTNALAIEATQTTKPNAAPAAPSAPSVARPVDKPSTTFAAPEITIQASLDGGQTWTTRPIYRASDGANWVELNPGETYRAIAQPLNYAGNPEVVGLRLLIDGRNTLPQAEPFLYAGTRSAVAQPIASLDNARWWSLTLANGGVYDGFYSALEEGDGVFRAAGRSFQVAATPAVDEATGQNGLIDVAFYALRPVAGVRSVSDVKTEEGGETRKVFEAIAGLEIDYQLACFRLRYASAARLAELGVSSDWLAGSATVAATEPVASQSATPSANEYAGTRGADRAKETTTSKKQNDKKREKTSDGVLR